MTFFVVASLVALAASVAALLIARRSRRVARNLALEMVQLRDRFARMESLQRNEARHATAERERAGLAEGSDERLVQLARRLDGLEQQVDRAIEASDTAALVALPEGGGEDGDHPELGVADLVRRGLRRQGYRRVYVLDVTAEDKAIVEAERGGITSKGLAWVEPDGQVVMRSRHSHRAFP